MEKLCKCLRLIEWLQCLPRVRPELRALETADVCSTSWASHDAGLPPCIARMVHAEEPCATSNQGTGLGRFSAWYASSNKYPSKPSISLFVSVALLRCHFSQISHSFDGTHSSHSRFSPDFTAR